MNCPPIRLTFGLCCLMLVAGAGVAGAQQAQARERLLVVPFENLQREGKYYWVSEAAATLLTSNLEALGVGAISREQRLKAFEQLQLPPVAPLAEATMIRLGQMIGAAQVVMGSFAVEDGQLTVKARAIRLDTGRMRPPAAETGPLSDFFAVFDRLSRQLLPPGLTAPERLDVDHGSLAVFENYVKGLVAETTAARIRFLNGALELTPDFAPARIALWQVYTSQGDHARAATAALGVPMASRLYRRARFLIALSKIHLKQYDEAFQGLKALLDVSATPTLFNNLGVIQARRGGTPQTGRATYYFTKAAEADPQDPDYAFNLGYAYWLDKDPQAAAYWLKEAVRRNPADGDAHFVLGAVLHATNAPVEGEREKELARQLSSTYADWERRPNAASEPVPKGLERLRDDLDAPRLTLLDTALVPTEQKDQKDLAAFHADRGRRMFEQKQDVEAIQELKRSLYLLPYQADVHLLLGRIYLRTGRLAEATEALKISLWSQDSSAAHAALGEAYLEAKDVARARAELQKALQIDPNGAEAKQLAARLDASQR
ncbi:MAG TPA: tetratricopeptide repeat protein [Vicinamibacterales bacterium]